jgi:hypothetical protein
MARRPLEEASSIQDGPPLVPCGIKRSGSSLKCAFELLVGKGESVRYEIIFKIKRKGSKKFAVLDGRHMISFQDKDAGKVPRNIVARSLSENVVDQLSKSHEIDLVRFVNPTDRMAQSVFAGTKIAYRGKDKRYLQFPVDDLKTVAKYAAENSRSDGPR